jgi:hypothetical protein
MNTYILREEEEEEEKTRPTCMSSLLQFMLCVDGQMDRQAVSGFDE